MRRFALAPLALLLSLAAPTSAASTSATPTITRPLTIDGLLASPSGRSELAVARDVLATHAPWSTSTTLDHVGTASLLGGEKVVSFAQTIGGIPVYQRGARVVVEKDGSATRLASRLEERAPKSLVPSITPEAAAKIAGVPTTHAPRLMLMPTGAEPLLVYSVVGNFGPSIPSRPVFMIDAHTGEIVQHWETALSMNKAKVYKDNPVKTPDVTEVTLTNDESKEGLQNTLVIGKNCIDHHATRNINVGISLTVHSCDLIPTIKPDASGDYVSIVPGGDHDPEDQYAELSMFYNTMRVYDHVHAIGFPTAKDTPINAIANLRMPDGFSSFDTKKMADPSLPLVPFDNAFFAEEDPTLSVAFGLSGDAMWFGQGTAIDFGYDGDVVYHEFGHFVVSRTIQLGSGFWHDKFGLTSAPGALNEGLADINSFFVSDDPELGEYSAKAEAGIPKGKGLRSALNTFTYPKDITGEVHQDSEPYTASMWEVYGGLDATKRDAFQKAHMKMLLTAPTGNLGWDDLAELDIKAIGADLGDATGAALRASFEKRGIKKDEPRVRTYAAPNVASLIPQLGIAAPGTQEMNTTGSMAPGLIQIAYDAPAGTGTKFTVSFKVLDNMSGGSPFGGSSGTPFAPKVLVKTGGEPISFTYPVKSDATATFDCKVASGAATCTGTADVAAAGKVHFMIVNTGQQGGAYDQVVITSEAGTPPPPPAGDAGVEQPADQPTSDSTVKSGCGCDVPGTSNVGGGAFALAALGLAIATRRRK